MKDTWSDRDLPVLKAIVAIYESEGDPIATDDITSMVGFDESTVQRALRALKTEPYFTDATETANGDILYVGAPTSNALRVTGLWPSPEAVLDRLIAALKAAGNDEAREPEERSRFHQVAAWLGTAASQVAIGALAGAGGNLMTG